VLKEFSSYKRAVRIMKGCGLRESRREHFRDMNIFPLRSQYIYSLMMFAVKNREIFDTNNVHYEINARHIKDIHMNQVNLVIYGNGVYHMAVRVFNALPNTLKDNFNYIKKFKDNLRKFFFLYLG
jgi:hypothetical protein